MLSMKVINGRRKLKDTHIRANSGTWNRGRGTAAVEKKAVNTGSQ